MIIEWSNNRGGLNRLRMKNGRTEFLTISIRHESYRFQLMFYFSDENLIFTLDLARVIFIHCWRESKIKGRNRRKQGSNQRTFFIHVRTRRELIFSSTSFSVSNTSPRVFALHCFACYCFTSLQEEKNIQRGNVIVTRRENDHDNKYALLPLIHPLFRSSLFLSDHWISRSIIVLKQTRDQNHFLDNFSKIFPPFGYFKREINLLLRRPLQ